MARPLSDEKRDNLLQAAMVCIAEQGLGAPISRIAREAGVAEGTLYTYFPTKQDLFSQLFVTLETDFATSILSGLPFEASPRGQLSHVWDQLVDWGLAEPRRLRALLQLKASTEIDAQRRAVGQKLLREVQAAIERPLVGLVPAERLAFYTGPVLIGLVETTQKAILAAPAQHKELREAGFSLLWKGLQP